MKRYELEIYDIEERDATIWDAKSEVPFPSIHKGDWLHALGWKDVREYLVKKYPKFDGPIVLQVLDVEHLFSKTESTISHKIVVWAKVAEPIFKLKE